ncbi:MAG: 50S ribosomal protein L17 [Bacteroidales bacterium]|nr:50S ribosomal protein L17 [Bacteroidales bacterium]
MRHKKKFNHLSRQRGHRHAMLANMASSLILHKRIQTTTAKAKALKIYLEPMITKAKEDTTHSRRQVFSYLQDKEAVSELFREVAAKVADRPGGYTRIIRLGNRLGDNADMCIIELVDYNENLLAEKAAASKSSRRRRGSKKKTSETGTAPAAASDTGGASEAVKDDTACEADTAVADEATAEAAPEAEATEDVAKETADMSDAEVVEEEAPKAEEEKKDESSPEEASEDKEKKE